MSGSIIIVGCGDHSTARAITALAVARGVTVQVVVVDEATQFDQTMLNRLHELLEMPDKLQAQEISKIDSGCNFSDRKPAPRQDLAMRHTEAKPWLTKHRKRKW